MPRAKLTIKRINRKRGTISLTIIRKIVATAFAEYDEQCKAIAKSKRSRARKVN